MPARDVAVPRTSTWKGSIVAHRFGGRPTQVVFGLAAAIMALSAIAPGFAQSAPTMTVFTAGTDASGPNTYIGRIETPRAGQSIAGGASVLLSGWAADTTAQGWSGFDQMQVYSGNRDSGGTKVADGMVGLNRPDVAEFLGPNFLKSGFSAVIPAGALQTGSGSLFVYLHTASKGWWFKTVAVNQQAAVFLPFPADPVVSWLRPHGGDIITNVQFGATGEYVLSGFALDRNPPILPNAPPKTNVPNGGAGNVGIQSITVYLDKLPGTPGYDPNVNNLGPTSPAAIAIGSTDTPLNHNVVQNGCSVFGGPLTFCRGNVSVTASFGPNYTFAGWVKFFDQRAVQPDMFHTLYATALSAMTGKSSTASVEVFVKSLPGTGTSNGATDSSACGLSEFLAHKCALRGP